VSIRGSKPAKNGDVLANFGVIRDKFGSTNKQKKPHF
jgi:hypothetical protein